MKVSELQQLLDQVPDDAEVTGINFKQNYDEKYSACIYVDDGAKSYRIKFWYNFRKSMAAIFIEQPKC